MGGKPDIIKAVVLIFAVGLVITGFTSLQASEDRPRVQESVTVGVVQGLDDPLKR
ncbi:hypothetical protein D777_02653 [Marinobacter nitratireducens]|uniref:Uncharacterized protein n=1 Tax=Marinobacter nitratireducens TaxID=1137280 RepID=A0A072MZP7_9GAMM|nr:hypothetical protein D777_02653 [Marinobacter nitratireducens]